MKEIRIPLEKFDLDGFINGMLSFLDGKVNFPTLAITWVEAPGRCPNDETDENWDFRSKLLSEPVYLFFPFAIPDLEGSFDCADGQSYMHPWDAMQRLGEGEEEPEDEDHIDECPFGEDIIGYLIQVKNGSISVASAICPMCGCCPPPTVDLLPDGDFLEQPLVDFVNRFISEDLLASRSEENGPELDLARYDANATQKPSDMKQEMKQRIKAVLMEDGGRGIDMVVYPDGPRGDFSVVIDGYTEDWTKRRYGYSYSGWTKELADTHIFIEGEGLSEEWTHHQKWGPITGMTREEAEKMLWDAVEEAKQELENQGREVKLRFLEDQRGAH